MTHQLMLSFWILLLLIALSAWFALAEMALASAHPARLTQLASKGNTAAQKALQIKESPGQLLAATQMGITAAALLMGIFGESALSTALMGLLQHEFHVPASWSPAISTVITIALVTSVSIVLGEIVPKRIAIGQPEAVACLCAPFMYVFIKLMSPVIHLLSWSADALLKCLPVRAAPDLTSVEDLMAYVDESERSGALAPEESHLMSNVLRLDNRRLASIMTPVADVAWLDVLASHDDNVQTLRDAPHSVLPLCRGDIQNVLGVVQSHDILQASLAGEIHWPDLPKENALFVPASLSLIDLLRTYRQQHTTFAFVVSEFGLTEGIVTLDDLMQTLVGDMMPAGDDSAELLAVQRSDGSWLLDGLLAIDEMLIKLDVQDLSLPDKNHYHTVGGFVLARLGHIPRKSESFTDLGWTFEVMDVDKNRVDQVLATARSLGR